ncbi:hypothetical protein L9F63_015963, partial [Diploptera punctata]
PAYLEDILSNPFSHYFVERAFNAYWSQLQPHCSICMAFGIAKWSNGIMPTNWKETEPSKKPATSPVWMSTSYFNTYKDAVSGSACKQGRENIDNSTLLTCRDCAVCVHVGCYGVTVLPKSHISDWRCDKCRSGMNDVSCCLCSIRGGAVKRTTDAQWAHVLCALVLPGVAFKDSLCKEPISVLSLNMANKKLQCSFCTTSNGGCTKCSQQQCHAVYHPMCALVAGAQFNISTSNGTQMGILCKTHAMKQDKLFYTHLGEAVWARHKNGRYYKGRIVNMEETQMYKVLFDDGSFSDNLYAQDLTNYQCMKDGPPSVGTDVNVLWNDGKTYKGIFEGTNQQLLYTVLFEDNSRLALKREAIYNLDEDMPKKVRGRLSTATAVRHEDHFQVSTDLSGQQRINRGTNPRYSNCSP